MPFANVSTERLALHHEAVVQHAVGGPGIVPILEPKLPGSVLHADSQIVAEIEFLERPYIHGYSLRQLIEEPNDDRNFDRELATRWMIDLCQTLQSVHDAEDDSGDHLELVHRDVTPGNVLVQTSHDGNLRDSEVFLNDFGLAHVGARGPLEAEQMFQGTRHLLAPELERGEQPTSASDVYQATLLVARLWSRELPTQLEDRSRRSAAFREFALGILGEHPVRAGLDETPENRPLAHELADLLRGR
jgi:serine/threonine protein kinase